MVRTFRTAVTLLLASLMTVGPAGAYWGMDCGCSEPEPAPPCCEPVVVECECGDCGAAAVEESDCGCGAGMEEMESHQAEPVEAKPQTAPITPEMPTDPKPVPAPATEPPVTTEKPAPPVTTPAAEPAEEMFDAPPAITPATPPAEEAPAEPPAEAPATDTPNDIFSSPPAESTPPAEEPAAEEPATEETEKEETPPAEKTEDPLEDFFNSVPRPSALQVAGGLESGAHRTWVDNTGKYRCEARLVSVTKHEVVLAKADGKLKTVSLERLSDSDLQFVHEQVVAKRELLARGGTDDKLASH